MISYLKGKGKAGTDEYRIKINPFGFSLGQVVIDMVYHTTKIYIKGRMFGGRKEEREMGPEEFKRKLLRSKPGCGGQAEPRVVLL